MFPNTSSPLREGGQASNWLSEADIPIVVSPISNDDSLNETMITVSEPPISETDNLLNEDFQTVGRKQKRKKPSMSPPEIMGLSNPNPAVEIKDKSIILFAPTVKDQSFSIKNITNIRMNLFKTFRCSFTVNVNRDGSLMVMFLDRNEACKALSLHKIGNIPVTPEWWKPTLKNSQKIVLYNIPLELSNDDLKDGLMNNKGEMLEVLDVHRMGKLDSKGTRSSKSVLFILPASSQFDSVFLFGQQKAHKIYQEKPLQCSKCFKLGHSSKYCSSSVPGCPNCLGNHSLSTESRCTEVPKCTNCDGRHQSTDHNSCPKYVQRAKVLKIALQENVPFPIAAMELAKRSKVPSGPRGNEAKEGNLALPQKPWLQVHKNHPNQALIPPTETSYPPLAKEHPKVAEASPSLNNPKTKPKSWSERVAAFPNISTQAITMQDRVGPHITNLIKYVASVDLILQSNMAKDKKASITKEIAEYYFSNSIFNEIGTELSSILSKYHACHLFNPSYVN